jgi:hypothetical protein
MTFEAVYMLEDAVAFNLEVWRRLGRKGLLVAIFAGGLSALVFGSLMLWPFTGVRGALVALPSALVLAALSPLFYRGHIILRTRRFLQRYPAPDMGVTQTFTLNEAGIGQEIPDHTCWHSWAQISEAVVTKRHLFIHVGPVRAFIVPDNDSLKGASLPDIARQLRAYNVNVCGATSE